MADLGAVRDQLKAERAKVDKAIEAVSGLAENRAVVEVGNEGSLLQHVEGSRRHSEQDGRSSRRKRRDSGDRMLRNLNMDSQIRSEIYRALEFLGADGQLLATVGSWGDTSMTKKGSDF